MKIGKSFTLNFEMTKHLWKASPWYFGINLANTLNNAICFLVQTLFYKYIIDGVIYSRLTWDGVVISFLLYYAVSLANDIINFRVINNYNEKEKVRLRLYYKKVMYGKSSGKDIAHFSSQAYLNMLNNAVYNDGNYLYVFSERLFGLVNNCLVFAFFFGIFLSLHPVLIGMALVTMVKNLICAGKKNKIQYCMYQSNLFFDRKDRYFQQMFHLREYVRELRLYRTAEFFIRQYKELKQEQWKENKRYIFGKAAAGVISDGGDLFIHLINIFLLTLLLVQGRITVGSFSMILTNFASVVGNLQGVLLFFPAVFNDAKYIQDIVDVAESEDQRYPGIESRDGRNTVKFDNVSFSYDGEQMVLRDINIELPLDKKIAVVGENGSGKSTFMKLLLGLYAPTSGKIQYCCRDTAVSSSRELFSAVFQEYQIFPVSIAENLLLKTDWDPEEERRAENALGFVGLKEKTKDLPDGIHTVLTGEFSENGVYLSGGERQRLAIARAFVSGKPILLLDEPSGSLDPQAEHELFEKLNQLADDRSVIFITHNPAYTKNADKVVVFDRGTVVEWGTPQELKERKGAYYRMLASVKH